AMWNSHRVPRLSSVDGLVESLGAHVHHVCVPWIRGDVRVVERARDERREAADECERLTTVIRAIEPAARLRLEQHVHALRVRGRHGDVALADEPRWQTGGQLLPAVSAIGAPVDASLARAGDDRPWL